MNSCGLLVIATQMYAKNVNSQQREGPELNNKINKILVVKFSMNRTYLSVS